LIVGKVGDNTVKHIERVFNDDREVWTDGPFQTDDYIVYVKAAWYDKKKCHPALSGYGSEEVEFSKIEKVRFRTLLRGFILIKGEFRKSLKVMRT